MAYLLSGEQPAAAAVTFNPLRALLRRVAAYRTARAQHLALRSLLELDSARLDDLGINRQDLFDVLQHPARRSGDALSQRRARASSAWLARR